MQMSDNSVYIQTIRVSVLDQYQIEKQLWVFDTIEFQKFRFGKPGKIREFCHPTKVMATICGRVISKIILTRQVFWKQSYFSFWPKVAIIEIHMATHIQSIIRCYQLRFRSSGKLISNAAKRVSTGIQGKVMKKLKKLRKCQDI